MGVRSPGMSESLWPREHGAYAQLIFPILSGLLPGHPGPAAFAIAAAGIFLFLANEPAAVLLGKRGGRRRRELEPQARQRLGWLLPAGLAAGAFGFLTMPADGRGLVILPAIPVLILLPLIATHREKSIPGELVVAAAMSSLHVPIAYAGGLRHAELWGPAAFWFGLYVVATFAVHWIRVRWARQLKKVGWTLVAVQVVALGLLVLRPGITR